jgi:hypothetical protein
MLRVSDTAKMRDPGREATLSTPQDLRKIAQTDLRL